MEILGIGMPELIAIFIGMLLIAGPQRMIRWAYTLGQYASKVQGWWHEAAAALQQEVDASGVNVTIPKDIPTRNSLQRDMRRAFNDLQKPVQEPLRAMKSEMDAALKPDASNKTQISPLPLSLKELRRGHVWDGLKRRSSSFKLASD